MMLASVPNAKLSWPTALGPITITWSVANVVKPLALRVAQLRSW